MKRVLIVTILLLVAAACATPTNTTTTTNTNANTNATNSNTTSPKTAETTSETDVIAREKQVWEAIKKKDWDGFGALLSDDHVYVGSSGVQDKKSSIDDLKEAMKDANITDASLTDFKTLRLDKDAVIVIYMASMKGTMNGKDIPPMSQRNSTVWANRGGKWVAVFHQDTDADKTEKPGPNSQPLTPKPAAGLTEADAVAREKQAWEAIEKKDWDTFSSMLADDQMEVENDGVYDKAGTLNGVSQGNMPKMALSDFKTTKIDDDAAIVTYTIKAANSKPGEAAIHASTIWVNRGGKWLAVFHQGTQAQAAPAR
jgi:hypothetical protein